MTCFYLMPLSTIASLTYIANVVALKMEGNHSTPIWFLGLLHAQWACDSLGGSYTYKLNCKKGVEINNIIFLLFYHLEIIGPNVSSSH